MKSRAQRGGSGQPSFQLLTWDDLRVLPDPEWLIDGILPEQSLGMLYGKPGSGKTFVALDIALSIATGQRWFGHETLKGAVVLVAAEGITSLKKRVEAWMEARAVHQLEHIHLLDVPVQLQSEREVEQLIQQVQAQIDSPIRLVIIDTLARCFVGGDENSARDTGELVAHTDLIRRRLECAVLLVHHTTKEGEEYRGSSALLGAANTMIWLKREGATSIKLTCKKQKDAAEFDALRARLAPVADALVLEPADGGRALNPKEQRCLDVLMAISNGKGGRWKQWQEASGAEGIASGTFNHYRDRLVEEGYVQVHKGLYALTEADPSRGVTRILIFTDEDVLWSDGSPVDWHTVGPEVVFDLSKVTTPSDADWDAPLALAWEIEQQLPTLTELSDGE